MISSNDCSLLESITPILSWDGQNSSLFLHSSDVLVTSYLTFLFLIILNSLELGRLRDLFEKINLKTLIKD